MATGLKRAVQRIFRDDAGNLAYALIDLDTLQPVVDPTGYKIINQFDSHVEEVTDVTQPDAPKSEASKIREQQVASAHGTQASSSSRGERSSANYTTSSPSVGGGSSATQRSTRYGGSVRESLDIDPVGMATGPARANATPVNRDVSSTTMSPISASKATGFRGITTKDYSIDYSGIGPNRPNKVSAEMEGFLGTVAASVLGPGAKVSVVSGDVNPNQKGWTAEGHKYSKSGRHTDELGADVMYTRPDGTLVTDAKTLGDLGQAAAALGQQIGKPAGIGFGPGYMGNLTTHVDLSGKGKEWGSGVKGKAGFPSSGTNETNVAFGARTGIGPTPQKIDFSAMAPSRENNKFTQRPDNVGAPTVASLAVSPKSPLAQRPDNVGTQPTVAGTIAKATAPLASKPSNVGAPTVASLAATPQKTSFAPEQNTISSAAAAAIAKNFDKPTTAQSVVSAAKTPTGLSGTTGVKVGVTGDVKNFTPAQAMFSGITTMTPEEKSLVSKALAGELSPETRAAALAGDTVARAHVGAVISSIVNRSQSKMYNSITEAVNAPAQYTAITGDLKTQKTTAANFATIGPQTNSFVDAFTKGDESFAPHSWSVTSYFNPDKANPSWGPKMANTTDIMDHRFGTLAEYGPSKSFATKMSDYAKNNLRDYTGRSYNAGEYNSLGSTPSRDTPSERGSKFGGTGLSGGAGAGRGSSMGGPSLGRSTSSSGGSSRAGGTTGSIGQGFGGSAGARYGGSGGSGRSSTSGSTSSAGSRAGGTSGSIGKGFGGSAGARYGGGSTASSSKSSSSKSSGGKSVGGGAKSAGSGKGYSGGRNTE